MGLTISKLQITKNMESIINSLVGTKTPQTIDCILVYLSQWCSWIKRKRGIY